MTDESLLTRVADIVCAHVSHNSVATDDLAGLIHSVYASLASLGQTAVVVDDKREPAVSIRTSIKPDSIACLECGAKFKMLKRHLSTDHGLNPIEYRARWNLPASYPLVAPEYAQRRKELAVKIGLGRKPAPAAPAKAPPVKAAPAKTAPAKAAPKKAATAKAAGRKKLGIAFGDGSGG